LRGVHIVVSRLKTPLTGCSILMESSQRLRHYGPIIIYQPSCWRARRPDFYRVHQTIRPPSINLDRNLVGSKDRPHISLSTGYYRSPDFFLKKSSYSIQENNNLQNNLIDRTYHKMLSTVVHVLLHPLLAVLTPHVRLYK